MGSAFRLPHHYITKYQERWVVLAYPTLWRLPKLDLGALGRSVSELLTKRTIS